MSQTYCMPSVGLGLPQQLRSRAMLMAIRRASSFGHLRLPP
jgi:hypothetical protein